MPNTKDDPKITEGRPPAPMTHPGLKGCKERRSGNPCPYRSPYSHGSFTSPRRYGGVNTVRSVLIHFFDQLSRKAKYWFIPLHYSPPLFVKYSP